MRLTLFSLFLSVFIKGLVLRFLALEANFRELKVSSISVSSEEQVTISLVSELPPSDSYNSLVSLDSRYGIWSFLFSRALIVLPKHDKERLIFLAYSRPSP